MDNHLLAEEEKLRQFFYHKNILVTGGTGSIGREIVAKLLKYEPNKVVVLNKDDSKQYLMQQKYAHSNSLEFILGDIRNYHTVYTATKNIDYIFHAAAIKQVPICENNPNEAIFTNINGSQNVIDAAIENRVKKVINISTDKVVNPTNIMGMTKLIAEKLFQYANFHRNNANTSFCSVRFGNVIGSRGSVIPLFIDKAKNGEPLTVTDQNMTRFIMSISEAANLTLLASYYCEGGETFIFKMKALKIADLIKSIKSFCQEKNIPIPETVTIGPRLGEKIHEELLTEEEREIVFENENLYVILPNNKKYRHYEHFKKTNLPSLRSDQMPLLSENELLQIVQSVGGTL